MSYKFEVVQRPAESALAIRMHTPVEKLQQALPEAFGKIMTYMNEVGAKATGAPYAAYYNMDMQNLDVEAGVFTTGGVPGKDAIQPSTLGGGKAAVCTHYGPYSTLPQGYDALMQWAKAQGHEGNGIFYEIYVDDPSTTPPDQLGTQIVMLLKGK